MTHTRIGEMNTMNSYHAGGLDYDVCQAVRAGNMVFLQGQTGLTLDGRSFVGKGDPAAQAEQAMNNVRTLLEQVGAEMGDICKVVTYVTKLEYRQEIYPVLARHLRGVVPVSTGLIVKALAHPDLWFEIDVYAVIPEGRA